MILCTRVIDRHTCTAFKIVEREKIYILEHYNIYIDKKQDELT